MIKSMTGYGRYEVSKGDRKVLVEMKSVNHRYLELGIKMPRKLNFLESKIRNQVKEYIERGKVDVFITYENLGTGNECVRYNPLLAREFYECYNQISEELGIDNDVKTSSIMRSPDVVTIENEDDDESIIEDIVKEAVMGAAIKLVEARSSEGEHLKEDIVGKLDDLEKNVVFIEEKSPLIIDEYKEKITNKVKELLDNATIDDSRIAMEVTLYADKICVDEEIVRLKGHIKAMRTALITGGTVGRKLDFITQELNREANTTLSKSTNSEISDRAIIMKTEIEKIREQIQNIE